VPTEESGTSDMAEGSSVWPMGDEGSSNVRLMGIGTSPEMDKDHGTSSETKRGSAPNPSFDIGFVTTLRLMLQVRTLRKSMGIPAPNPLEMLRETVRLTARGTRSMRSLRRSGSGEGVDIE
jgi:hypothetical protein